MFRNMIDMIIYRNNCKEIGHVERVHVTLILIDFRVFGQFFDILSRSLKRQPTTF